MEKYVLENDKLRAVIREKSAELISLRKKKTIRNISGMQIPGSGVGLHRFCSRQWAALPIISIIIREKHTRWHSMDLQDTEISVWFPKQRKKSG